MDFQSLSPQEGLENLRSLHDGLYEWIKNLVERNKELEDDTADLQNARDAARRFRQENDRLKKRLEAGSGGDTVPQATASPAPSDERANYVLVLIDGDALPFTDDLLEKGYEGGKAAAEKLLDASFSIARRLLPKTRFTTHMTVYTNVTRTAGTLIEANTIADADDFRGFIHGFSRAKPLSNMIDIGTGTDGADRKLRDELKQWHLKNPYCRLILLGASHDNGYAHALNLLKASDSTPPSKVVLLEGATKAEEYTDLPFRRERISSVFNTKKLGTSYRASPVAAVRPNRSKSGSSNAWTLPRRDSKPNGGDDDLIGWGPPGNSDANSSYAPVQSPTASDAPSTWRSRSAAKAKAASHNRTKSFFQGRPSEEAFARIKSLSPGACNQYYLRGQCYYSDRDQCTYSHDYEFTPEEIEAMKLLVIAKAQPCRFGEKCTRKETCFRKHLPTEEVGENDEEGTNGSASKNATQTDGSDEDEESGGANYNW